MTSSYFRQLAKEKRNLADIYRRNARVMNDIAAKTNMEAKAEVEDATAKEYENFADKLERDESGG